MEDFNKQKQIESLEKRRRDLEKKNDELEKKNDDLEKKYNDLERKKNDLQIANQELHDFCAKTEEQKDQLTNDVITARNERDEINKEKQRLKESGDAAAKSAEEYHHYMTCAVNARDQVVDGYDTVMERKKELQSLVESYHADLSDKEEELKRTTDAYNDMEARFRALEDENINLEMEMHAMHPAIDMMNVIHDKLAESFEVRAMTLAMLYVLYADSHVLGDGQGADAPRTHPPHRRTRRSPHSKSPIGTQPQL